MHYCCENEPPFTFVWKIKNFSFFEKKEESYIESPSFTIPSTTYKFILRFYPQLGENCSCQLIRRNPGENSALTVHHMFELTGIIGDSSQSESRTSELIHGGDSWCSFNVNHQEITENKSKFLQEDTLTIKLYMWGELSMNTDITLIIARTRLEVEKCTLNWVINNFSSFSAEKMKISFPSGAIYKMILIAPEDDNIKITSHKKKSDSNASIIKCRICILDSTEYKKEVKLQESALDGVQKNWVFPPSLTKSKLRNEKHTRLVKDTLRLSCKFYLSTENVVHSKLEHRFEKISIARSNDYDAPNNLQQDIYDMYIRKQNTDVQFQIEGKLLPAHKFVLAARSPVLLAMSDQEQLENKSGIIDIQGIEYDIFDEMLTFMHGGSLQNLNYERAVELIAVAEKYQVDSLKEACSSFLQSILSVSNACRILAISDTVHDDSLKEFAVEYINFHRNKILVSDEWKELKKSNTRLVNEVLMVLVLNF